jgi:predicted DNA-binding protein (UPF0251 family)
MCSCWYRRRRKGLAGRTPKPVAVSSIPAASAFYPYPVLEAEPVYLELAEVEALKLIDIEKLSYEDAGRRMNISRNTVWRLVENAREKLARAIFEGRPVIILKEESFKDQPACPYFSFSGTLWQ